MEKKQQGNIFAIVIMFFLFAMISFVTGFQNPFGVIVKQQFAASNFMSQLGNAANFIAYAFMGLPAGMILSKKGYKFTALRGRDRRLSESASHSFQESPAASPSIFSARSSLVSQCVCSTRL